MGKKRKQNLKATKSRTLKENIKFWDNSMYNGMLMNLKTLWKHKFPKLACEQNQNLNRSVTSKDT